jgi:hypothetical protein
METGTHLSPIDETGKENSSVKLYLPDAEIA